VLLARTANAWAPPQKVTIAEYSERWLAERGPGLRPRTLAVYRRLFIARIAGHADPSITLRVYSTSSPTVSPKRPGYTTLSGS
jgi:hypothetical protein